MSNSPTTTTCYNFINDRDGAASLELSVQTTAGTNALVGKATLTTEGTPPETITIPVTGGTFTYSEAGITLTDIFFSGINPLKNVSLNGTIVSIAGISRMEGGYSLTMGDNPSMTFAPLQVENC